MPITPCRDAVHHEVRVRERQPERERQPARGVQRRRPGEHGDQLATGRRADALQRTDRERPRDQAEQPPLREADGLVHDERDDADDDRHERADHADAVQHPRPPVAQPHRQRPLAARLVRRDVAEVVRHQDRDRQQAHHHATPPGGGRHGLHHHVRRAARGHEPEEQEHHQLAEAEARVRTRSARIQERGHQGERSHDQDQRRRRRERQCEAADRSEPERDERGREDRSGRRAPLATRRGGPIRSCVSTPRTPSK